MKLSVLLFLSTAMAITVSIFPQQQVNEPVTPIKKEPVFGNDGKLTAIYKKAVKSSNMYESGNRDSWQKPYEIIERMGDLSNKTIIDLGAGPGYFSVRILPFAKKLIAVDVSRSYLNTLEQRYNILENEFEGLTGRLVTRKINPGEAGFARGEADIVFLSNSYHHLSDHVAYFKKIKQLLPEDGMVVIIDFKQMNRPVGPPPGHKLVKGTDIASQMRKAGYKVIWDETALKWQNLIIARVP